MECHRPEILPINESDGSKDEGNGGWSLNSPEVCRGGNENVTVPSPLCCTSFFQVVTIHLEEKVFIGKRHKCARKPKENLYLEER